MAERGDASRAREVLDFNLNEVLTGNHLLFSGGRSHSVIFDHRHQRSGGGN